MSTTTTPDSVTSASVFRPVVLPSGRRALRRCVQWIERRVRPRPQYAASSYSLEGEDMVLRRILLHRRGGFYVDVGAHHPMRFSNTYHFYQRGWRGINIDATPGSMEAFAVHRSHDVNLEIGVSAQGGDLTFYRFDEGALNGFCRERALDRDGCSRYRLESTLTVATAPLSRILDDHLPAGQEIDFLNVDVEGMDLEVLCSNDWRRYRPHIVLAEELDEAEEKPAGSPITQFMRKQGYAPCARTTSTLLFEDTHRT